MCEPLAHRSATRLYRGADRSGGGPDYLPWGRHRVIRLALASFGEAELQRFVNEIRLFSVALGEPTREQPLVTDPYPKRSNAFDPHRRNR